MDITAITHAIETHAPLAYAAPWDCSGLQVAAIKTTFSSLAVVLDPTPQQITKALNLGCDCILSHHPLSLKPTLPNTVNSYHQTLKLLLSNDVALYAAHTSLDSNLAGPSGWLADAFSLQNRHALEMFADDPLRGFGLVGTLPIPLSKNDFLKKLITLVPEKTATICGNPPDTIHTVAYCTGSGASLIPLAKKNHADIYISGDIKYHAALDASLCVIDVGHHSLEEIMMQHFSLLLREENPSLTVTFIPSKAPFRLLHQEILEDL